MTFEEAEYFSDYLKNFDMNQMTMQIHKTDAIIKPKIKLSNVIIKNKENKTIKEIKEDKHDGH